MPGSATTPGRTCARVGAQVRVAFRRGYGVGTRIHPSIAAQWLAYAFPCRRFDHTLADMTARLGASVVRYAFTAEDLHLILLAGLPAHSLEGRGRALRICGHPSRRALRALLRACDFFSAMSILLVESRSVP